MINVIIIPKNPDKNTAGSISSDFPHRKVIVKTAKPNADPNAAKLPLNAAVPDLSVHSVELKQVPFLAFVVAL